MRPALVAALLCCTCALPAAEDDEAHRIWEHGRPGEALSLLLETAAARDAWSDWYNVGLAAHDAGHPGLAVAGLARAHVLAPARSRVRIALGALTDGGLPSWCGRLGPFALLGTGWAGVAILGFAGLALGFGCVRRRGRMPALALAAIALFAGLPGAIATTWDASRDYAVTLEECALVDAAGEPSARLPAGTLMVRGRRGTWDGRVQVDLADGRRGFVARDRVALVAEPRTIRLP